MPQNRRPGIASIAMKRLPWVVLAFALATVAFGSGSTPSAPDVSFTTLAGEQVRLAQWRGKVVLVTFWATSCPICMKEMPELVHVYRQYQARGFEIVAVAMAYDMPELVRAYAAKNGLPFPVAIDTDGRLARAFHNVTAVPTAFVVDKDGRLVSRTVGMISSAKLRAFLDTTL